MSKELEELKRIDNNITYLLNDCGNYDELVECFKSIREHKSCEIIEKALQRLEAIDNASPSEALEKFKDNTEMFEEIALKDSHSYKDDTVIEAYVYHFNNIVIERALLKAQELEKILDVIKEYEVDIWLLKNSDYNNYIRIRKEALVEGYEAVDYCEKIIPEELFNLLKEMFKNENNK